MNLILFVAKIFLCSGILFTYYWFFLRNKRFHHYNRFYLLAIVIISLVFPFVEISISEKSPAYSPAMHQAIDLISVNNWEGDWNEESNLTVENNEPILTGRNIALFAYSTGLILLFILLFKSLFYIIRIRNKYNSEPIGDLKLYNTVEPGTPFSFFKSIFWNHQLSFNSKEGQQIFRHELFHVRQNHSSDALFMEIVCIICWFNPFFHLIRKELKAIHEFLADQYAISDNDRYAYAELLVMESIRQKKVSFVHPFFHNNIKRRIAMITQFNKTRYGYWSRVMALPILILLFCVITLKAQQKASIQPAPNEFEKAIQSITVLVDAGHGGKDPGANSPDNKYVEKNLALAIAKKIRDKAPAYNINVILTREDDNAPELPARTELASRLHADLLVSIHIASEPPFIVKGNTESKAFPRGILIYTPKPGTPNLKESQALTNSLVKSIAPVYSTYAITKIDRSSIWIIDKAPCPAVLLECGNIAHKADLDFILNEDNQEKIAEGILKGIAAYKPNKDAKQAFNESNVELNTETTGVVVETKGPSNAVNEANVETTGVISEHSVAGNKNLTGEKYLNIQDDIKKYLIQHFLKTIRYPAAGKQNNEMTSIFFSVDLDAKGKIHSIEIYFSGPPKGVDVQDFVITGIPGNKSAPMKEVKSEPSDMWEQELNRSVKSFQPPANIEHVKGEKYYFRAVFSLNNDISKVDVTIEPALAESVVVGTAINSNQNVNTTVNKANNVSTQVNMNDPVVVMGYKINPVNKVSTDVAIQNDAVIQSNVSNTVTVQGKQVPIKNSVNNAVVVEGYKSSSKNSPNTKLVGPLPIDLIRKFKVGETSMDAVKKELGEASNQFMDSYVESLAYYGNNERLMLTFSREDGRLINYSYFKDQHTKTTLNYDDVKEINKGTTPFEDILKKFGNPSEIYIDNNTEGWVYKSDNARLSILTNDKLNPVVHQMSFDSQSANQGNKSQK